MTRCDVFSGRTQPLADRAFAAAAMAGAFGGAVGGVVLGAGAGTEFPLAWGTLGTMLGGGAAAGCWAAAAGLWNGLTARRAGRADGALRRDALAPAAGA
jgi:hypothetical protein